MRTSERMTRLKEWVYTELCEGRQMKAPSPDLSLAKIIKREPRVYLGWAPTRMDKSGQMDVDALNVCPGVVIMPNASQVRYVEEKRWDRANNVYRSLDLGQQLSCTLLFTVYEPGIRLPGFVESMGENGRGADMSLLQEGTEQGLFTLLDWLDDCKDLFLRVKTVPGTDLFVDEESLAYSLLTDQKYIVDRRPIYYGFVNVDFQCYANDKTNEQLEAYLN